MNKIPKQDIILQDATQKEYQYGFVSDIKTEKIPKGLNEKTIQLISKKKNEPPFLLDFRINAYRQWKKMKMPKWAYLKIGRAHV